MVDRSPAAAARNKYYVAMSMPGSRMDIEEKTGMPEQTISGIIRRMKERGEIEIIGTRKRAQGGGSHHIVYKYIGKMPQNPPEDKPPPKPAKPKRQRIVAPVTQYHTRWIGGGYPCQSV